MTSSGTDTDESFYSDHTLDSDPDVETDAVVTSIFKFSAALHEELRKNHPLNFVYSPLCLNSLVAMVKLGVRGEIAQEIEKSMLFPHDDRAISKGFAAIFKTLRLPSSGHDLIIAQRMFIQSGYNVKQEFVAKLKNSFHADLEEVDFIKIPGRKIVQKINSWVETETKKKMKGFVYSESVDSHFTRILVISGIYFIGSWEHKFYSSETTKMHFYLNDVQSVEIDMMKSKPRKFLWGPISKLNSQVIVLPYKGGRLSLVIFVPVLRMGLSTIEAGLKYKSLILSPSQYFEELQQHRKKLSPDTYLQLFLPRFHMESIVNLEHPLKTIGLKNICLPNKTDFSEISSDPEGLFVYDFIQKSFVEIDEDGCEIEAQIDSQSIDEGDYPEIIECRADHPFYFQIVDHKLDLVLFSGICSNPLDTGDDQNPTYPDLNLPEELLQELQLQLGDDLNSESEPEQEDLGVD